MNTENIRHNQFLRRLSKKSSSPQGYLGGAIISRRVVEVALERCPVYHKAGSQTQAL
jgi:hypothetical protein